MPSSPIVPVDDESLLFANAGMNQFKDIFLGLVSPDFTRATNSQKCLRVSGKHNDLEEVGKDTYHHTFFEMLGNWSFGDYFKAEAIRWAWELLTRVWGIDENRLWAGVFGGDEKDGLPPDKEAAELWTKVTPIPHERVLAFGKKDNFWEMGQAGPCGPCSEIHIDLGPEMCDKKDVPGHKCGVNAGCQRYFELWNLVFIQYNRMEDGSLLPLKARHIDTGAGLERIVAVLQNKRSNYDTDLFMPIIERVAEITGHKYSSRLGNKTDNAFRVIADHIRTLVFAITDGAVPSNEGRGYVIRRILRRASRFARELGMEEPFLYRLVDVVVDIMGDAFNEIADRRDFVSTVIQSEETSFVKTLGRGIEIFETAAGRAEQTPARIISGEDAFSLYDTYGFPLDLTRLMAEERKLDVDTQGFEKLMEQQRERGRAAQKDASLPAGMTEVDLPQTEDVDKYKSEVCESTIAGFIDEQGFHSKGCIEEGVEVGLVLNRTVFYAEAGGQVGDCGIIESDSGRFIVEDTTRIANCVVHKGQLEQGTLCAGDTVNAKVSKDRRWIKRNHTATHLLQWALRQVVDKSVAQQGSLVSPDYLRFDFTCPGAPSDDQIKKVEQLVREQIAEDKPVVCADMPREEAENLGATALFGEKYGDNVRVVAIGAADKEQLQQAFSKEFCGGTHVSRLGEIGGFKIIKEESISAGVRRITAVTGKGLVDYLEEQSDIVGGLCRKLKVRPTEIVERVDKLLAENKRLSKELKSTSRLKGGDVMAEARALLEKSDKVNGISVVVGRLSSASPQQGLAAVDMLKKKAESAAIVLGFANEQKVTLLAGMTTDVVKKGLKAPDVVKEIAPVIDGGGGGRPDMAQAGGKNPAKLNHCLNKARELIKQKLTSPQ